MAVYLFYGMICLFMVKYTILIFFKYKEKLIQEILVTITYNGISQDLKNIHGEGNGNSLLYSCLKSHGQRSLAGYSPWSRKG